MEALKSRLAELSEQIAALQREEAALRQQLAEAQTDIKVGDRVKLEGTNMVWKIDSIRPGYSNEPKYFGRKIKKDGTPGVQVHEVWQVGFSRKLEVIRDA